MATELTNGNDTYSADGGEAVYGLLGNDTIKAVHVDDTWGLNSDFDYFEAADIYGNQGDDTLTSLQWGDRLYGDSGNDRLYGGGGRDHLEGGSGNDIIWTGTGEIYKVADELASLDGELVWAGSGDDSVHLEFADNGDIVHAEEGYDTLYLTNEDAQISQFSLAAGGSNAGLVTSGFEVLRYFGADIFEVIEGAGERDYIYGAGGTDLMSGLGGDDLLSGQEGADVINGNDGNDDLYGGEEGDTLRGDAGDDTGYGGTGNDFLYGGGGDDALHGQDDNDTLRGEAGSDALSGGDGDDTIYDGSSSDTVNGDDGNDTLWAGTGTDTLSGGIGNDTIREEGSDIFVDSVGGPPITIVGGDTLNGDDGNDNIQGGSGKDKLSGGTGSDILDGGSHADALDGGSGSDTTSYASAAVGVQANLANAPSNTGDAAGDTYVSIEYLTGSGFDDGLRGDAASNVINGGAGNDTINGSAGNDTLTGGLGLDQFNFNTALNAATNTDAILSFSVADDTIGLSDAIFTNMAAGTLAAAGFAANATGAATTASHRIIFETDTGALYFDADGSGAGAAIRFATVGIGTALTNADFLIV